MQKPARPTRKKIIPNLLVYVSELWLTVEGRAGSETPDPRNSYQQCNPAHLISIAHPAPGRAAVWAAETSCDFYKSFFCYSSSLIGNN